MRGARFAILALLCSRATAQMEFVDAIRMHLEVNQKLTSVLEKAIAMSDALARASYSGESRICITFACVCTHSRLSCQERFLTIEPLSETVDLPSIFSP